ncbi:hypothetical protein HUT18_28415 [Streptomyces sp. NA04227]|uniref:hypothetical protein n=1 Tax=Streptomyces sp. NA04227 TaxID=2742136 RepID=UPI0015922EB8|nr:hypothetical protein [Streptomyces sp. NA04227]QKW09749.1 hypothetical protein HUT18_28415 [Streptomyces sp. NA04227]
MLLAETALDGFLTVAAAEYLTITEANPTPCFAVLTGRATGDTYRIEDLAFGRNVRATHPSARQEFATTIVPRFGAAYENPARAWWLDPSDLLRIDREADAKGLDVLGSIHMHPDWHRLGPAEARTHPLDERPTAMDRYVFRGSGWPVNLVCYLERRQGSYCYALSAWDADCRRLPLRLFRTAESVTVSARHNSLVGGGK